MIWKNHPTLAQLNQLSHKTMLEHLGIEFTEIGADYLIAKMPVDHRTHQPFGLLHGGASGVLAESLGSTAAMLCVEDTSKFQVVGTDLNCSHVRSARKGFVFGKATPLKIGRRFQFWHIEISDEADKLVCVSRLTVAVVSIT